MGVRFKHFKVVMKHKRIVFRECRKCGIGWQGFIHDFSKLGHTEFAPSARYFQGTRSPIDAEKEEIGYSSAWLHHKGHNKHHWEYWTDFGKNGEVIAYKIPYKYVVEMICDWVSAGMVYSKGKWTQSDPLNYYNKVSHGRYFHKETEELILKFLNCIKENGLEEFHKMAKSQNTY